MSRAIALGLTVLTGFSGLVYEVAWQRYVATLLGSHSEATAAVLALFLGGLSLGYALFGRVTRMLVDRGRQRGTPPRLLGVYGAVEASIGLHALLFPWLFQAVQGLSLAIPHEAGGLGFALDVVLTALLVLPPTILMGGTIPLLTQALADSIDDATRIHAFIYAFNTAGAFAGALAAGFALIPWLGLQWVVVLMGFINLAAGASFAALGRHPRAGLKVEAVHENAPKLGIYAPVALLVGFAAMVFQTVLIRLGGLSLGSSQFTFSMVVAVFVLCIALGSFAVSALPRVPRGLLPASQWALLLLMAVLYPALQDSPYWAYVVRSLFRDEDAAFYPYYLSVFVAIATVLVVPIGLSGAALPLLFDRLKREFGELGAAAGRLYAWNTVGSLLGALLGGYLLLFWLDLDQVYRVGLAAVAITAVVLTVRLYAISRVPAFALVLLPALAGVFLMTGWAPERLSSGLFRTRMPTANTYDGADAFFDKYRTQARLVYYRDDPNSSVAVEKTEQAGNPPLVDLSIITNGKPDGSIRTDYPTMALAALIPALFAEQLEQGFVIGFGTGVTAGELAAIDSMQRVVVAEISPAVIDAGMHFDPYNQRALSNPKTEVVVSDAYRALLRSDDRYDVIASEPSNPWVTGVEMLFSRDFLEAAKSRLRPGGVYAQWFHSYENDDAVVELVLRTYADVFDHVAVWYALGPDLILLGFDSDERALDLDMVRRRAAQPDIAAGLRRSGIDSLPALLGHELLPLGVVHAAGLQGDIHTVLHPVLSYRAARAFFRGQQASLPPMARPRATRVGRRNSLLLRYSADKGGLEDADFAAVAGEACKSRPLLCTTVMAAWTRFYPNSETRDKQLAVLGRNPNFIDHLKPKLLLGLAQLYTPGDRDDITPSAAGLTRMTDLFERYFFHGMPFSRPALAALWQACRDEKSAGSCDRGLASAESRVGPLVRSVAPGEPSG